MENGLTLKKRIMKKLLLLALVGMSFMSCEKKDCNCGKVLKVYKADAATFGDTTYYMTIYSECYTNSKYGIISKEEYYKYLPENDIEPINRSRVCLSNPQN